MRARGQDDRSTLHRLNPGLGLDFYLSRAGQLAVSLDDVDALLLQNARETANQALDCLVLSGQCCRPVEVRLARNHTEFRGVADRAVHLGDVQPLLRRNASSNQTGTAGTLLLDKPDREPEVAGVEGCGVSTRTAANYDDVVQI